MKNKNPTYIVKSNEIEFFFTEEQLHVVDLEKKSPGEFNIIKDHRSVNAKLIVEDLAAKKFTIEVEGETFEVRIKDELDQMLGKMGFGLASGKLLKEIRAPMPGLVLKIAVCEGQELAAGDKILILEAMKMENSIVINTNATIKRIAVVAGQAVEKGQVLVELD